MVEMCDFEEAPVCVKMFAGCFLVLVWLMMYLSKLGTLSSAQHLDA